METRHSGSTHFLFFKEKNKMPPQTPKTSPCINLCRYVGLGDTQICEACGRTYDDLDSWSSLSTKQKRLRMRQAKDNLKKLAKN